MSDQGITDHNENSTHNSKAEARVDSVAKANLGSNTSHLAEPLGKGAKKSKIQNETFSKRGGGRPESLHLKTRWGRPR